MIFETFYDKLCDIFSVSVVDDEWTDVDVETLVYENLKCEYYIAPRWNVVNWQYSPWTREVDKDRLDLVIPWNVYDPSRKIEQWMFVTLRSPFINEGWKYMIDQVDYYSFPDWSLECLYVRINQVR